MISTQLEHAPWPEIARHISVITGEDQRVIAVQRLSGGDINEAFLVETNAEEYFVKINQASLIDMFEAEFMGLEEMAEVAPRPLSAGTCDDYAFLILEYLPLTSNSDTTRYGEVLAHQLVALHERSYEKFGWHRDNFIGSNPQYNAFHTHWAEFWWHQRLLPQLTLTKKAFGNHFLKYQQTLNNSSEILLKDHSPTPRLCHGDLWSGNKGYTEDGRAVLFDPAPYYGDRETDIAMTELFGGFSEDFYTYYYRHFPKSLGYEQRKRLYNLYHILNHVNLFGGSYVSQAENLIEFIISDSH